MHTLKQRCENVLHVSFKSMESFETPSSRLKGLMDESYRTPLLELGFGMLCTWEGQCSYSTNTYLPVVFKSQVPVLTSVFLDEFCTYFHVSLRKVVRILMETASDLQANSDYLISLQHLLFPLRFSVCFYTLRSSSLQNWVIYTSFQSYY